MNYLKSIVSSILLFLLFSCIGISQTWEEQFDQMLEQQFSSDIPGATVLVAKKGDIIYHKAFGMANMELDVPMETDMVFEIASITKQFTAVSILMLMEQGKLNLDDDITKFIKDYPTDGHHISIHHLLTHTSGIKSYTSMESWMPIWRKDLQPKELIDFFKNEPMDFVPGEKWQYNNSAYFILGYIIEKASGQTYEEFVEQNIFKPLDMQSSRYGSQSEIIKKRAYGYQKNEVYANAEYLSLTQPYAAGSLMSTVKDLFIWNRAIRTHKLVKQESIELAFTNHALNNGEKINYGYGWGLNEINGSPTIEHSGGIFGYSTNAIYLPEEDVFVAIYANCDCSETESVSTRIAAIAIEKPYPETKDLIAVNHSDLEKLVGIYDFTDGTSRIITLENNQLYSQLTGGSRFKIFPFKKNIFFFDNSFASIQFKETEGQVEASFTNRINKTTGIKTAKPIPVRKEIQLRTEIMEKYVGVYEIAPNFEISVTLEDGKLMTQATGQGKFEIFAESQTKFFLKVVDAQIEFMDNNTGNYDAFILYQGGLKIPGKKKN
ncbi:MAG: serine hydrolase [Saprospiraceae bacterium]|nr:serine hydrolase [Saprospiraceae bacterium]